MNLIDKFNRALIKAIDAQKVVVRDLNAGAIREATLKFNFSHEGEKYFYELTSIRNASGMKHFGYKERLELKLVRWNQSYMAGFTADIPVDIDSVAVDYIHNQSVITQDESNAVITSYSASFQNYVEQMC